MGSNGNSQNGKRQPKSTILLDARTRQAITALAQSDCPVLIAGESGVGKRSNAEFIHAESHFCRAGFVEIEAADCTPEQILSALSTRGTVYISEVADVSSSLQKLVVENYFDTSLPPSSRLLCGTSRELLDEVKSRRMREDFFHFISAITLRIAPLRFRKTELLPIVEELLRQYSKQFDRPKPVLSDQIIGFLLNHSWPGNFSELQTAVKTFVAIGDQSISLAALKAAAPAIKLQGLPRTQSLKEATRAVTIEVERQLISEVLVATGGNRKRAADELGISYKALLYKLKQGETVAAPSSGNGVEI
jgi:DNA-binding NtrC family response regulator